MTYSMPEENHQKASQTFSVHSISQTCLKKELVLKYIMFKIYIQVHQGIHNLRLKLTAFLLYNQFM